MALFERLGRFSDIGLLVMRAGLGVMMVYHGFPKLFGGPAMWEKIGGAMSLLGVSAFPVLWGFLAACAEGVGGALLAIGLWTRPAAFFLAFTMLVAAIFHLGSGDGLQKASHAIELLFVFTGLILVGPGKLSVDKK